MTDSSPSASVPTASVVPTPAARPGGSATPAASAPFLSDVGNDEAILAFMFAPGGAGAISFVPPTPGIAASPDIMAGAEDDHRRWTLVEARARDAAEALDFATATQLLDEVVAGAPTRASARNNRAQLRRLVGAAPDLVRSDLDAAVDLARAWLDAHGASPAARAGEHALVGFQRSVLASALTQRATVLRAAGADDAAAADLAAAAAAGGRLARAVTSGVNPYAALCHVAVGRMLAAALPALPGAASGGADSGTTSVDESGDGPAAAAAVKASDVPPARSR